MGKNAELKKIISDFGETYTRTCEASWKEYVSGMEPGQPAPPKGKIYGDKNRKQFAKDCNEYKSKALAIITGELDKLNAVATAAPNTDAVNAISLFNMRKNVSQEDVETLLDTYGDNIQAFKTIMDISSDKGIRIAAKHPTEEKIDSLNGLKKSIDSTLNLQSAENGHASKGFLSMLGQFVDESLTDN